MKNILTLILLTLYMLPASRAADGFDNNLIGTDAFEMSVDLYGSGNGYRVVFGPSGLSGGGINIPIPNYSEYNAGVANYFKIKQVMAHPRSAYFDRVDNVLFYYRIYNIGAPPPNENDGYTLLGDYSFTHTPLNNGECYTSTQIDNWTMDRGGDHFDVLAGLPNGTYILQFYIVCDLHDVGDESTPCNINASLQCDESIPHTGRQLSSRFPNGLTDPNVCSGSSNNYYSITYAPGSKIRFQVTNSSPLTWLQFQAQKSRESIRLEWATSQERDVDYFDIQRSTDGIGWTSLHEQSAVGYSDQRTDYTYTDLHPLPGVDYYRLRSVDFDGSYSYSPTIAVAYGTAAHQAFAYPNPATTSVQFRLDAALREQSRRLVILDALGRVVYDAALSDSAPTDEPLPLAGLRQGLYFAEFRGENGLRLATGRFLKSAD
ncbi:MAG TPA: T9SS type A sorting domain-containing protein [Saprospiraceae bacterium]|nr:T9SS type A sorting domain-containing protein [Saprospiraceae bacterium]